MPEQKRVIIAHGWEGHPEDGWIPWLKTQLEAKGFIVIAPQLPDPDAPHIEPWLKALAAAVGTPDAKTYFVGHSMGNQVIVRYLMTLPANVHVGGAVFLAGFFKRLTNLGPDPEVQKIAKEWLGAPVDLAAARTHLPKSTAIFSDDDKFVPLDNQDDFREKLGSKIVIEHGKGHYSTVNNATKEVPSVLQAIQELSR